MASDEGPEQGPGEAPSEAASKAAGVGLAIGGGADRLAPLDGMRAVFVTLVLFHHLVWAAPGYASDWAVGGWIGLDGFFVLSGFLIGTLVLGELDRRGSLRYGTFLARRLFRLYPALLVALTAMATVSVVVEQVGWTRVWPTVRAGALYVMNWPFGHGEPLSIEYTHLWSLSVEMHFYVVLPLLLWALVALRTPPWSWAAVIGVVMGAAWWRRQQLWTGPASFPLAYVSTDSRADTLLWGVLVALAVRQAWIGPGQRVLLRVLVVPALVGLAWAGWRLDSRDPFTYRWGLTLIGLAYAVVLTWVLLDGRSIGVRLLASRPMTYLGTRSYSIYLYHYPLFFFASRHLGSWTSRERVAAVLALSLVLAELSYRLVERPGLWLRDRVGLGPRRTAAEPA